MLENKTCLINLKSCVQVVHDYPSNYFSIVITSPPYKQKDGYSDELMIQLAKALYQVIKPAGLAFINFGPLVESWGRSFDVYDFFEDAGFLPVTTIAWIKSMTIPSLLDLPGKLGEDVEDVVKLLERIKDNQELSDSLIDPDSGRKINLSKKIDSLKKLLEPRQVGHYTPIDDERRMNNLYEYIHIFAKDTLPPLDRWSAPLGVPYADKSNLTRGNRGKFGDRHCSGNCWLIPYATRKGPKVAHKHEFPLELVNRCLTLAKAKPGDVLLEPFTGGGSTIIAALQRGMSAVGYEIDPETKEAAQARISSEVSEIAFHS